MAPFSSESIKDAENVRKTKLYRRLSLSTSLEVKFAEQKSSIEQCWIEGYPGWAATQQNGRLKTTDQWKLGLLRQHNVSSIESSIS